MRLVSSMRVGLAGAALLVAGGMVGCDDDGDVIRMDAGTDGGSMDGASADAAQLTDSQIAAVMGTANAGEIQHGMIAQMKGQSMAVRNFAQMMVMMHSQAQTRLNGVMQMAGLTAAPSTVSQMLQAEAQAFTQQLNSAAPGMFDRVYAQSQVAVHERVLMLLDTTLIPQADNAALKSDLMTARGEVVMHLSMAKQLRDSLSAGDGGVSDGGATDAGTGG